MPIIAAAPNQPAEPLAARVRRAVIWRSGSQLAAQLIQWPQVKDGARTGTYSGYRAVMRDTPQTETTTLILYAPTCAAGLRAIVKENGNPNLFAGNGELHWLRGGWSLTSYCQDNITFARLSKTRLLDKAKN